MQRSAGLVLFLVLACGTEDGGEGTNQAGATAGGSSGFTVAGSTASGAAASAGPAAAGARNFSGAPNDTSGSGGLGGSGSAGEAGNNAGTVATNAGSAGSSAGVGAPANGGTAGAGSGGTSPAALGGGGNASGSHPGGSSGAGLSASAGTSGAGSACAGRITYTLARAASPTAQQMAAYERITAAMDRAVQVYNCNTSIQKSLNVSYNPDVATADGNPNGSMRFGSTASMNYITAMHEISHTVGIGANEMDRMVMDGIFPGETATAQLRAITGNPSDEVHADTQHFWPYGLNYTDEVKSDADLVNHCKMVIAIRKDLGL